MEKREIRHAHRSQGHSPDDPNAVVRFARQYGWWRVVAIPLMIALTIWFIVDIATASSSEEKAEATSEAAPTSTEKMGPDPADSAAVKREISEMPPGGSYTKQGKGTFHEVGEPGAVTGKGGKQKVR